MKKIFIMVTVLLLAMLAAVAESDSPQDVKIINVNPVMGRGEWLMVKCSVSPESASYNVRYSSTNQNVLSVTPEGKLIALKEGTASVIATLDNGISAQVEITIMARPTSVKLSLERTTLGIGETMQTATVLSKGAYGKCTYRSKRPEVAVIDENGVITALQKGEAVIEVTTYNSLTDKVTIKVSDAPEGLEISETEAILGVGQTHKLFAKVTKGYGSGIFMSSDERIVTVTEDGVMNAVSEGSCTVKAITYNGISVDCSVTVCPAPEGMWVWTDSASIGVGETLKVYTQLEPDTENTHCIFYTSSNDSVAVVDEAGIITGKKAGSAVITVSTYNGILREISVSVGNAPKSMVLDIPEIIAAGDSADWSYTLNEGAAGNVVITSSDESILMAGDGILTGIKAGTVSVSVKTYNGISEKAVVRVLERAESIAFINPVYTIETGSLNNINAVVPENTFANIEYSLADESICAVLPDGRIIALREGETVLYASAFDGALYADTVITVHGEKTGIDLRDSGLSLEQCTELQMQNPDLVFIWEAKAFGVTVASTDTELDLSNNEKIGNLDNIRRLLDSFPKIEKLDLSFTGFEYEELAVLREEYRGRCKIVWTVRIANRWNIRTDQTAFSTLLGPTSVHHTSKEFDPLKYCEDMMALDIGHNNISTLDFLLGMPHLKVLILSDSNVSDITVLGQMTELEYVEIFTNRITDISPLANLTNMIDLNISNNNITDLSPIMELEGLQRVWMTHTKVSSAQKNQFISTHPNCEVNTTAKGPDRQGWRSHHNYFIIYEIFHTNVWIPWETEVAPAPNYHDYD